MVLPELWQGGDSAFGKVVQAALVEEDTSVVDSEPPGCPSCNGPQVLPWLDAHKLVALDVRPQTPGGIPCDRCGKVWWVVSLETAESPK
jgi:hypothetical protein